jgi:stearoyl-CoA desaturase (delta-9 desaturase)
VSRAFPALTALPWAGLVRIAPLHHVNRSVDSLCHLIGERPFRTRRHDRTTNLWPLALLSFVRLFECLGWVRDVHWSTADRVAARRA